MTLTFELATEDDAPALAALHTAVAGALTREFGRGPWGSSASERGVLHNMKNAKVLVARDDGGIAGTLRLATKKPWAIDVKFFTPVDRALYLLDMAVRPSSQRGGIGNRLMEQAVAIAKAWPAQAIRLDAFDAPAGAGEFYRKCGMREVGRATYRNVPLIYFERLF